MAKKLGVFILVACLLIGIVPAEAAYNKTFDVWDGSVTENWITNPKHIGEKAGNVGVDSTYYIDSAADFIAFRNAIVEGVDTTVDYGGAHTNPFWRCTVELRCDIDLNNINLKFGIGTNKYYPNTTGKNTFCRFAGIFNGNGHIIKNIKINPNTDDGAKVDIKEHACDTDDNNVNEAVAANDYIGLFGYVSGDNEADKLNGGRIMNLHLENVEITLPNEDIAYRAGALIGYGLNDVNIASCSVKNVTFKRNAATDTQPRCYIGGMAGYLEGANATHIRNSYVDGVDFSQLPGGLYITNLFMSGMFNANNLNFLNIYSKDVKKCESEFVAGTTPTKAPYYYDSLIYTVGGTFTAGSNNGKAYAEVPERYINKEKQDTVKIGTWDHDNKAETPEVDNFVGTYTVAGAGFAGGGTQGNRSYPYYMMPVSKGYSLDYTPTASERIILGTNAKLMSNGEEVTAIPETATEVTAQVEIMNATREAQDVEVIIAGYKDGKLERVVSETLSAAAAAVNLNNGAASTALGSVIVKPSVDTGWAKVETTKSISTEGLDEIKVFCWNALSDLLPISNSGSIGK